MKGEGRRSIRRLILILARDSGGLGQSGNKGGGEKWPDSRCILEVGLTEFAD